MKELDALHLKRGFPVFRVHISADNPDVLFPVGVALTTGAFALTPTDFDDRADVSAPDPETKEDIILVQELYAAAEVSVV